MRAALAIVLCVGLGLSSCESDPTPTPQPTNTLHFEVDCVGMYVIGGIQTHRYLKTPIVVLSKDKAIGDRCYAILPNSLTAGSAKIYKGLDFFDRLGSTSIQIVWDGTVFTADSGAITFDEWDYSRGTGYYEGTTTDPRDPTRVVTMSGRFEYCDPSERTDCGVPTVTLNKEVDLSETPGTPGEGLATDCRMLYDAANQSLRVDMALGEWKGHRVTEYVAACQGGGGLPRAAKTSFIFKSGGVTGPGSYGPFKSVELTAPDSDAHRLVDFDFTYEQLLEHFPPACVNEYKYKATRAGDDTACSFSVQADPGRFELSCTDARQVHGSNTSGTFTVAMDCDYRETDPAWEPVRPTLDTPLPRVVEPGGKATIDLNDHFGSPAGEPLSYEWEVHWQFDFSTPRPDNAFIIEAAGESHLVEFDAPALGNLDTGAWQCAEPGVSTSQGNARAYRFTVRARTPGGVTREVDTTLTVGFLDGDLPEALVPEPWDPLEVHSGTRQWPIVAPLPGVVEQKLRCGPVCENLYSLPAGELTYEIGLCQPDESAFFSYAPLVSVEGAGEEPTTTAPTWSPPEEIFDLWNPPEGLDPIEGLSSCNAPLGYANLVGDARLEMLQLCATLNGLVLGIRIWDEEADGYGPLVRLYQFVGYTTPDFIGEVPGEGAVVYLGLDKETGKGLQPVWIPYQESLSGDADGDGVQDEADVCPFKADPGQADSNGNGLGDACDVEVDYLIRGGGGFGDYGLFDVGDTWILVCYQQYTGEGEAVALKIPEMSVLSQVDYDRYDPPWVMGDLGSDGSVDVLFESSFFGAAEQAWKVTASGIAAETVPNVHQIIEKTTQATIKGAVVGDIDGDGDGDLIAQGQTDGTSFTVLWRAPRAGEAPALIWYTEAQGCGINAAKTVVRDFDGDGIDGVLVVDDKGKACFREGAPLGGLTLPVLFDLEGDPYNLHVVDFDADGKLDLITFQNGSAKVYARRGQ